MMKKQKIPTDINALLTEIPDIVFKNKEKHLPWFATTVAVIITTVLCAGFDGSNIYLTLSTQTRDNVLLTVILAIGTTFLMNFSGTVLGDMLKSYVQKVGNIKKWMIGTFLIVISLLFVGVIVSVNSLFLYVLVLPLGSIVPFPDRVVVIVHGSGIVYSTSISAP